MVTVDITEPKCPEDLRKPCKHTTSFPHPGFLMKTPQKESYSRSSCLCCQLICGPHRNTRSTPAGSPHAQALPLTQAAAPMAPASFMPRAASPKATSRVLLVVLQPHRAAGATQPWACLVLGLLPQGGGRGWVPYPALTPQNRQLTRVSAGESICCFMCSASEGKLCPAEQCSMQPYLLRQQALCANQAGGVILGQVRVNIVCKSLIP